MKDVEEPRLDRSAAYLMAAAGTVALVVGGLVVPWDWVPGGDLVPMQVHELFTEAQIQRAEAYSSIQRALGWASYALSIIVALIFGFTPLGAMIVRLLPFRQVWQLNVMIAVGILLLAGWLSTLPFALVLRKRNLDFGLTTQSTADWLVDQGKSLLVTWVIAAIIVLVVIAGARRFPRRWFALVGAVAGLLTMVGSILYPVLVEPLFNDFRAMPPNQFRASVVALADRQNVSIDNVLIADASRRTTTLNAYVSGLGQTRRVVVYDTLMQQLTPSQARVVIAHELAHARHRDVLFGTLLGVGGCLLAAPLLALALNSTSLRSRAAITGPQDPASVALILALVATGSMVSSPAANTVSRAIEARADREALAATHQPEIFVQMQRRLALAAIHDPTPPAWSQFWFGSHPTVLQRAGLPASMAESR